MSTTKWQNIAGSKKFFKFVSVSIPVIRSLKFPTLFFVNLVCIFILLQTQGFIERYVPETVDFFQFENLDGSAAPPMN